MDVIEIPVYAAYQEDSGQGLSPWRKIRRRYCGNSGLHAKGQPLLVGTVDVDVSEHLNAILKRKR